MSGEPVKLDYQCAEPKRHSLLGKLSLAGAVIFVVAAALLISGILEKWVRDADLIVFFLFVAGSLLSIIAIIESAVRRRRLLIPIICLVIFLVCYIAGDLFIQRQIAAHYGPR